MVTGLTAILLVLRWRTRLIARDASLHFEPEAAEEMLGLRLQELTPVKSELQR